MDRKGTIGQRLMIGVQGDCCNNEMKQHLKHLSPGGVILFSRNIRNREQVATLIREIKEVVSPSPLIAVDQEGGLVARFLREMTVMPGNMALGAVGSMEKAYQQGVVMSRELKAFGIDINLAPVVDVVTGYNNPGITVRSFGADPDRVGGLAVNLIKGMQSNGIGTVAKHFPGKGAATEDAHFDLPRVEMSWDELVDIHLHPFRRCIEEGVEGIMSSHVIYGNIFGAENIPATFSPRIIKGYLRGHMKFNGVAFSDDLEMGAISRFFSFEETVIKTVLAGHDMILICSDYEKQRLAFQFLVEALRAGTVSGSEHDEAVTRIERMRIMIQKNEKRGDEADRMEAQKCAQEIAEESITVVRGETPVPIPFGSVREILALIPDLSNLESLEDGFEVGPTNFVGRMLKERFPVALKTHFIALDPAVEEAEGIRTAAAYSDLIVAFIFNAQVLAGQRLILEELKRIEKPVVYVLLRNPFDLELLEPRMTTVVTYGYRKVQIDATIRVLAGEFSAVGKLPFPCRGRNE